MQIELNSLLATATNAVREFSVILWSANTTVLQTVWQKLFPTRKIPSLKGKELSHSTKQTSEYCCCVSRLHYLINVTYLHCRLTIYFHCLEDTIRFTYIVTFLKKVHAFFTYVQVPHATITIPTNKAMFVQLHLLFSCSRSCLRLCGFTLLFILSTGNTIT